MAVDTKAPGSGILALKTSSMFNLFLSFKMLLKTHLLDQVQWNPNFPMNRFFQALSLQQIAIVVHSNLATITIGRRLIFGSNFLWLACVHFCRMMFSYCQLNMLHPQTSGHLIFKVCRVTGKMSSNSTASISQARKAVEQLKMEACMDRMKVSVNF